MPKKFNYPGIFRFLFREKALAITAVIFCIVCTVIGVFLPRDIQGIFMEPLMAKLQGMEFSVPEIFVNNLKSSGIIVLGGFIISIVSFIMTGINFIVLGSAMNYFGPERSPLETVALLLPHGIFEIPAIMLSLVCGMYITRAIFFRLKGEPGAMDNAAEYLLQAVSLFIMLVIPMLISAALIEVYLSPLVAGWVIKGGN